MARRRSFTVVREPVEVEIGGDMFHGPPIIPPAVLGEMLEAGERIAEIQGVQGAEQKDQLDQTMKVMDEVFSLVLTPDSAKRFSERLYSRTDPLDLMREVMPALEWLVEEYSGDRPTEPSPPSGTGSSDGGTTSTDGAPNAPVPSTPSTSPPTDSATSSTEPSST